MTTLHWNFKDLFRSLRLGFSAKKVWMCCLGLLLGLSAYSGFTYLAYLVAGHDVLTVWENYRLLPFPEPSFLPFPWFAWLIYALGVLILVVILLVTGTAVTKVAYEQLRGDEFYESKEAFRFAFKNASSVLLSPLLIIGFVLFISMCGVILGLVGRIPQFGVAFTGLMGFLAFFASLFIVYLGIVLLFSILLGPAVAGATRSDMFDTLFEVFSCVNEQPWRLIWYTALLTGIAKVGSFILGLASSLAGRVGYSILHLVMGARITNLFENAAFYFKINLPDWWPLRELFRFEANIYGLPHIYAPSDYLPAGWGNDIGSLLLGVTYYAVALIVIGYGLSVWFTGQTLSYAILVHKKDSKNILAVPEDAEELIEPVVSPQIKEAGTAEPKPGSSGTTT